MPVPESATVTVGSEALELTVILPLVLAADCGVNRMLNVTLALGVSVRGRFSPLMLNAPTVDAACEMVTLVPPVLVSESVSVALLPTWTLPKARPLGFAVNWPAVTAVPDSGKFMLEFAAFETNATLPLTLPAD